MALLDDLRGIGVDIDAALTRFMGNEELLEMMYKKMPDSIEKNKDVIPQIQAGQVDMAIQKAHTLKGNMGNLSITPMYNAYSDIVNKLRAGDLNGAAQGVNDIQSYQNQVVALIKSYM